MVVIGGNLGVPIFLKTSMYGSGRDNKPWTVREHQDQMLVSRERDKILQAKEWRKKKKPWNVREHCDQMLVARGGIR